MRGGRGGEHKDCGGEGGEGKEIVSFFLHLPLNPLRRRVKMARFLPLKFNVLWKNIFFFMVTCEWVCE